MTSDFVVTMRALLEQREQADDEREKRRIEAKMAEVIRAAHRGRQTAQPVDWAKRAAGDTE